MTEVPIYLVSDYVDKLSYIFRRIFPVGWSGAAAGWGRRRLVSKAAIPSAARSAPRHKIFSQEFLTFDEDFNKTNGRSYVCFPSDTLKPFFLPPHFLWDWADGRCSASARHFHICRWIIFWSGGARRTHWPGAQHSINYNSIRARLQRRPILHSAAISAITLLKRNTRLGRAVRL